MSSMHALPVGPGKTHPETGEAFEMPVTPGEGVLYGKFDGTEIEIEGSKHSLIRDQDVLVKFKQHFQNYHR